MNLTPKELEGVAVSRYWKERARSIKIGFLIVANIIALFILALFLVGAFPPEIPPTEYSLNGTTVTMTGGSVYLDGEEMQRDSDVGLPLVIIPVVLLPVALFGGYAIYHANKAKKFGRDLLEESITKEKASGE